MAKSPPDGNVGVGNYGVMKAKWHISCVHKQLSEVEVSPPFLSSHLLLGPVRGAAQQGLFLC
ncbi:MAG: hypothetical protein BBJ60_08950 [Desulfobacterales bacterium S7086C20]|nr:MAG: hypothetical protein BBJ60_08950 [Desulfobacterales bacterium S7086C20]